MNVKQVIVLITKFQQCDGTIFRPRKGKLIAQACHASISFLTETLKCKTWTEEKFENKIELGPSEKYWIENGMPKIVVGVDSYTKFRDIELKARSLRLPVHVIEDSAKTEFKEPTITAMAIGPAESGQVDKVTSELKLL